MNNLESWEAVIGLETHVQLNTKSKIFTSASTAFGDAPNTHIDPVVCGLPGTLPVLNETVLEYAVKTSLALNLNVAEHCNCLLYTSPSPRDLSTSRMPSSA